MKTAFAVWKNRIAPVFDVSRQVVIVGTESERIIEEKTERLPDDVPPLKARRLSELGVDALICGAVSRALQMQIEAHGLRVISFVAGDVQQVVQAWLSDAIGEKAFTMPGCWRKERPALVHLNLEECLMKEKSLSGMGSGPGRGRGGQGRGGQGRRGQGRRPMNGPAVAQTEGACVCPQCGYKEPHERGIPCMQKQCAKCGAVMTRQ